MRPRAALIEKLEPRRLVSSSPVLLAAFASGAIHSQVAVDAVGDVFGTTPASSNSAGGVFEIPAESNTSITIASFGPNDSANTLGIGRASIFIDAAGDLFG